MLHAVVDAQRLVGRARRLDERARRISEGLSAADKAKADLQAANRRVEEQLSAARNETTQRISDAERMAQSLIEDLGSISKSRTVATPGGTWMR